MPFFQKHPVISLLLVPILLGLAYVGVCLFKGVPVVCIKMYTGGTKGAFSFITKTREAADILEKSDFKFQITPEITVRYMNGNMHVREREGEDYPFETLGNVTVEGKYPYFPLEDDVYPVFTRNELLDRLLEEAKKQLPPEERDNVQINRARVDEIFKEQDAARNYKGFTDANLIFHRRFSHLFGSIDD